MIKNLRIRNFRGIKDITIEDLTPFSIIAGENNVGKSTVLEALFLLLDYQSPDVFFKLNGFRSKQSIYGPSDIWGYLIPVGRPGPIVISADVGDLTAELILEKDSNAVSYQNGFSSTANFLPEAKLKYAFKYGDWKERGFFSVLPHEIRREALETEGTYGLPVQPVFYVPALRGGRQNLAVHLSEVELRGETPTLLRALQLLDSRISAIVPIARPDGTELYLRFKDNSLLPLFMAGDGLVNVFMFAVYILSAPSSIVLIDEIENGIHYSKYEALWEALSTIAARNKSQITATTHSYEFVSDAVRASRESTGHAPGLYRLERDDTDEVSTVLSTPDAPAEHDPLSLPKKDCTDVNDAIEGTFVAHYSPLLLAKAITLESEVR